MNKSPSFIVALDFDSLALCMTWVDGLDPHYCALKIGAELFTRFGPEIVKACIEKGFRVFLDLKFHDIPNTVARAVASAADLGVWMLNVHALGGPSMLEASRLALEPYGASRPLLIAVTVLTSHDELALKAVGIQQSVSTQVNRLARLAFDAGLDGVVCAAWEVPALKKDLGTSFLTITPGIRLPGTSVDDQKRVMSPEDAKKAGCDYLVIGRTLTRSATPLLTLKRLYEELRLD